jgi:hypothetical protein
MIKKITIGLAVIIVVFLAIVSMQPSHFKVQRSIVINAPTKTIFPHINDFKKMNVWSPWLKYDPNCKIKYEGPAQGVGTSYSWVSEKHLGEGKMTILEVIPNEKIMTRLEFFKPYPGVNAVDFILKGDGKQTTVTWLMSGKCNFMNKAFGLFMSMDKMVGGEFEKGLAELKGIVEKTAK